MSPRDRVLAALNHHQPDRIPIDLSGHRSSGIAAIAYARLRDYLELPNRPIRVYDPIQQLAVVDEDVLERFEVDTIELGRGFALEESEWADWTLPDGTPCQLPAWTQPDRDGARWVLRSSSGKVIAQMPDGALYFEQCYYPFLEGPADHTRIAEALDECMWAAVASPPGPIASGEGGSQRLAEGAKRLRQRTDRAILGLFGGNLLEMGQFLYRNDGFLMLMGAEPGRVHDFLNHLVEYHLANLERFLGTVGPFIDIIVFGDDLGCRPDLKCRRDV